MLKLFNFILFFSVASYCQGQDLKITLIKAVPDSSHMIGNDSTISYPIFKFKNSKISNKINLVLKKDYKSFYEMPDSINDIKSILEYATSFGLVGLSYTILRDDKKYFAFVMENEGMGAYSSYWETYYCFDKTNGDLLTLDNLLAVEKKKSFLKFLRQQQKENIRAYKKDISKGLKNNEIEKDEYDFALSQIKNDCWDNYSPKNFKLLSDTIEIVIDCEFPNVAKNINPPTTLTFPLSTFKLYVKPKYKSI